MEMKLPLVSLPFLLLLFYHCTTAIAQSPAQSPANSQTHSPAQSPTKAQAPSQARAKTPPQAPAQTPIDQPLVQSPSLVPPVPAASPKAPVPAGPNITKILEKAGGFSVFVRLLRNTQVINQIENQLSNSNSLTILAPTNAAFSGLKSGTLNSLNAEQKVQLLQFHLIPNYISITNFQTVSNPVLTQASDTYNYPLNITTTGNIVNISTGLVNTSISGTVYSDNQLAIYKVDKVLLPLGIFAPRPKPPAPSPAPLKKPKKEESSTSSSGDEVPPVAALNLSGGLGFTINVMTSIVVAAVAAVFIM
ncbi:hypothetical protein FEM48_Zijuj02G0092200 [Ziziphus jujuba var. spinosa]|uniref:FAS1 domain-containing protein n=1 Tax=Ziziphus jujuba var. spinosa TaxID=714518 RepID=A0A978VUW4_ZIZJJ|nr:hypothetical protein FEM48_Zijuj02G0092200 [Ziziphus jujuba var. spinosa]